jgi:hypothetical protein
VGISTVSFDYLGVYLESNIAGLYASFIYLFFVVLGLELRAYTLSHSTSSFLGRVFFEIGSHKLFAWVGFEPQSS